MTTYATVPGIVYPPEVAERFERWASDHPESYPSDAVFDDTHALMSRASFEALPDYSCSVPTGVVPGKCWRRRKRYLRLPTDDLLDPRNWLVGRYDPATVDQCLRRFREVLISGERWG